MPSLVWRAGVMSLLVGCGGVAIVPDGGSVDAGGDSSKPPDDAGLFDCYSAQGHRVCRGTNKCSEAADTCGTCFKWQNPFVDPNDPQVGICSKGTGYSNDGCYLAPDGNVCFSFQDVPTQFDFLTAPFPTALLFLKNGGPIERIRYADESLFTGEALPLPTTCPKLPVGRVCGGNCGPCADGEICHGRSPTHPYSYCMPIPPASHGCSLKFPKCDAGFGCFILDNGGAPTPATGYCLELSLCNDLAANLPGGGACVSQ